MLVEKQELLKIVTIKSFMTYLFMPTLCFQLIYPRTNCIRPFYLIKMAVLFIVSLMLLFYIVGQYIMPIISFSYKEFEDTSILPKVKMVSTCDNRS